MTGVTEQEGMGSEWFIKRTIDHKITAQGEQTHALDAASTPGCWRALFCRPFPEASSLHQAAHLLEGKLQGVRRACTRVSAYVRVCRAEGNPGVCTGQGSSNVSFEGVQMRLRSP